MHNNFYFLRQVSAALESTLAGAVVSECFSQSKDELVIRFEIGPRSFFIRASLLPGLGCLSFTENFQRARKNSADLFSPIIGQKVSGIRQFNNERSFAINLSEEAAILFKMHGNRTNIALAEHGVVTDIFRKSLVSDRSLKMNALDREIDFGYEHFNNHLHDLKSVYFTLGKVIWRYLEEQTFFQKPSDGQWAMLQSLLHDLNKPSYYITLIDEKPVLSLVKTGEIKKTCHHPLEAATEFFFAITRDFVFSKEQSQLLNMLRARIASSHQYSNKNLARLTELKNDHHYRLWADLIMANLHAIPPGSESVVLTDFSGENRVEIKLRQELTPQKNAAIFYKKAKNQHIEIERLEASIRVKQEEMQRLEKKIKEVEAAADLRMLRNLRGISDAQGEAKKQVSALPYHEFIFKGFRIWVGKNAVLNDVLTLKYSHKEDLWLHVKDAAGSHVLIKHQAGKNFPKDVIEYAASLAAYHSRRKHESLCPVIATPKKFVRKRKGDPAGAVVVEREEVILAERLEQ